MKSANPPRLAAWILQEFGPHANSDALAGDLWEGFQQGRSQAWYWRQVLAAIRWRRPLYRVLILVPWIWWMTLPRTWRNSPLVSRPLDMAIFMAVFLAYRYLPGLRARLRAVLVVLIAVFFCLLHRYRYDMYDHYTTLGIFLIFGIVFLRKTLPPPPYHLTMRELVFGDPDAERQRLIAKLHLAMMQETDPELRQSYAESIAALRSKESPIAKAAQ